LYLKGKQWKTTVTKNNLASGFLNNELMMPDMKRFCVTGVDNLDQRVRCAQSSLAVEDPWPLAWFGLRHVAIDCRNRLVRIPREALVDSCRRQLEGDVCPFVIRNDQCLPTDEAKVRLKASWLMQFSRKDEKWCADSATPGRTSMVTAGLPFEKVDAADAGVGAADAGVDAADASADAGQVDKEGAVIPKLDDYFDVCIKDAGEREFAWVRKETEGASGYDSLVWAADDARAKSLRLALLQRIDGPSTFSIEVRRVPGASPAGTLSCARRNAQWKQRLRWEPIEVRGLAVQRLRLRGSFLDSDYNVHIRGEPLWACRPTDECKKGSTDFVDVELQEKPTAGGAIVLPPSDCTKSLSVSAAGESLGKGTCPVGAAELTAIEVVGAIAPELEVEGSRWTGTARSSMAFICQAGDRPTKSGPVKLNGGAATYDSSTRKVTPSAPTECCWFSQSDPGKCCKPPPESDCNDPRESTKLCRQRSACQKCVPR
jgi:hypothetical protein